MRLRLTDPRARSVVEVAGSRAGLVTVAVSRRGEDPPVELADDRADLVGDLVRRVGELAGVRVVVVPPGTPAPPPVDAVLCPPGEVTGDVAGAAAVATRGVDPLAVRLTMLETHYLAPVDVSWSVVTEAARQLAAWRSLVASWAELPSRRMPEHEVDALVDAWHDDLDVPRALAVLRRVEGDARLPAGAKFELFAYADRVLALELVRDVGRGPAPASALG